MMRQNYIYLLLVMSIWLCGCNTVLGIIGHTNCDDRNSGKVDIYSYAEPGYSLSSQDWSHPYDPFSNQLNISSLVASPYPYRLRTAFTNPTAPTIPRLNYFYVLNNVSWDNFVHVSLLPQGGLQKDGGNQMGSALSFDEYKNPGLIPHFFECQVNDGINITNSPLTADGLIGFGDKNASPLSINYLLAFHRSPNSATGTVTLWNSDANTNPQLTDSYNNGDIFRLYKFGSLLMVTRNGAFYAGNFPINYSPTTAVVKTILISPNFQFNYVRTTFGCSDPEVYYPLKRKLDGSYYTLDEKTLRFKYDCEYNAGQLNYTIYDWKRNPIQTAPFAKNYGDNRVAIDVCGSQFNQNEIYSLEVINEKRETFMLRFKFKGRTYCTDFDDP
jgi:hypothetical protein